MCSNTHTHTHTFSQTCTHTGTQVHTFTQPVSEITEWEKESPLEWVLYLGISDLFTLMSVGKKVKKNKSARQQLHVFSKQKLIFNLSRGFIHDSFVIISKSWKCGTLYLIWPGWGSERWWSACSVCVCMYRVYHYIYTQTHSRRYI